ncbi:mitochondrial carrier protein MTM1-like isoform X2 [Zingiber officinale]|uniref:mitochondrial carrier protein MTM1-like isoform X2 n=1 Tax=Zingiber officinale TaxID=94328 RepID=UPI001C4AE338|nr:mitochondrial carrier protein MTM1-like isoform X2 [Zingiber officinale]
MVGCSRSGFPKWIPAATRVEFDGASSANASKSEAQSTSSSPSPSAAHLVSSSPDFQMGFGERALSAAGAAVISAILVNPLDVAKTRLQAQAAGVAYYPMQHQYGRSMASIGPTTIISDLRCSPSCNRAAIFGTESICPPDCFQYKDTMDVFNKVVRQEGFARLWRGTNASLALAVPTAHKEFKVGVKPPGIWKTLVGVLSSLRTNDNSGFRGYRVLWTGMGAQLARDVPFSAICWPTLEPIRRRLLSLVGDEGNAASVLGANFLAGFAAGSLAAFATCPLDVAKTRRQIEKDPSRALNMTTRQTLAEVWRTGGVRGLFTGVGPRVGRAGPSVGIVVSFYEVVKYILYQRNTDS